MMTAPFYRLGILGNPISQSLSPKMHQFWLKQLGLEGCYTPHLIKTEKPHALQSALLQCQTEGYTGLNITIPFKQTIIPYLTDYDTVSQAIGAVNTLHLKSDGTIKGTNTDVEGFSQSVPADIWQQWQQNDSTIAVLGNGGASRAIIYALIKQQVPHITLIARNIKNSEKLIQTFRPFFSTTTITPLPLTQAQSHRALRIQGIINTLPPKAFQENIAQLTPFLSQHVIKKTYCIDIVYSKHTETPFCHWARRNNLSHQDGLSMLIYQGALSFKNWTNQAIPDPLIQKTHACLTHPTE